MLHGKKPMNPKPKTEEQCYERQHHQTLAHHCSGTAPQQQDEGHMRHNKQSADDNLVLQLDDLNRPMDVRNLAQVSHDVPMQRRASLVDGI